MGPGGLWKRSTKESGETQKLDSLLNGAGRLSLRARHLFYCLSGCSRGPLGSQRELVAMALTRQHTRVP